MLNYTTRPKYFLELVYVHFMFVILAIEPVYIAQITNYYKLLCHTLFLCNIIIQNNINIVKQHKIELNNIILNILSIIILRVCSVF